MEKKVLHVEGMPCEHCKMAVEKAVRNKGGDAVVNLAEKTVVVSYDPGKTSLDEIIAEIEEQGYDVVK